MQRLEHYKGEDWVHILLRVVTWNLCQQAVAGRWLSKQETPHSQIHFGCSFHMHFENSSVKIAS